MKSNYNIPCISIEDYENMKRKLSHITAHISPFENYIEDQAFVWLLRYYPKLVMVHFAKLSLSP